MGTTIDGAQLEAWAKSRMEGLRSPIAKAIYAGLATRATRPGGFDLRVFTSNMDDAAEGNRGDKEKQE